MDWPYPMLRLALSDMSRPTRASARNKKGPGVSSGAPDGPKPGVKDQASFRLTADSRPSRPDSTSKVTFWLSAQPGQARTLDGRDVHEHILLAAIGGDETEAFGVLNHFTVPVAIVSILLSCAAHGVAAARLGQIWIEDSGR